MKSIKNPSSQTQEVLYYLIKRISIDRRQMMLSCSVLNLPDQIMRLRTRYKLSIVLTKVSIINKFGRVVEFGEYSIKDKKKASDVYRKIQEENPI